MNIIKKITTKLLKRFEILVLGIFLVVGIIISLNSNEVTPGFSQEAELSSSSSFYNNSKLRGSREDGLLEIASESLSPQKMSMGSSRQNTKQNKNDRKIKETHSITLQGPNDEINYFYDLATNLCESEFCYIENGSINISSSQSVGTITLKLEPNKLSDYLESILSINNEIEIINRSRSSSDRTSQFQDISARKKSQEDLRARLQQLVQNYRGDNIRSLLEIERELARVQGQIESMDAQIRSILAVTEKTTLNLRIQGRIEYSPTPKDSPVVKAFNESWNIVERNIAKIILIVSGILPWFVIGLILYVSIRLVKRLNPFNSDRKSR